MISEEGLDGLAKFLQQDEVRESSGVQAQEALQVVVHLRTLSDVEFLPSQPFEEVLHRNQEHPFLLRTADLDQCSLDH